MLFNYQIIRYHVKCFYYHGDFVIFTAHSGDSLIIKGTFFCFLQHPQIQKKSQYIKYLCCDDVRTLHQWVNGIRIAKVGFDRTSGFDSVSSTKIVVSKLILWNYCFLLCAFVCSMGSSYMWTTRKPWREQRRPMIGPLSLPPAFDQAPALLAYQVTDIWYIIWSHNCSCSNLWFRFAVISNHKTAVMWFVDTVYT